MKKALAILMVLAAITGVAVADVADIAVSGFAQLTWGVDFDNDNVNGFKQGNEWDISIPLLAKKTFTTKSEGDAYAEISIVDAQVYMNADESQPMNQQEDDIFTTGDKKIDKVTAKLVFGNVYATISNQPSFYTDNANIWAPIKNDDYFAGSDAAYATSWVTSATINAASAAAEGDSLKWKPGVDGKAGTKVGYMGENFAVAAKVASNADWTATGSQRSVYAVGFDASMTPSEMITVSGTYNYLGWDGTKLDKDGKTADSIISVGGKVVATPMEALKVTVGFDGGSEGVTKTKDSAALRVFAYDVMGSVAYKFVEAGAYYASAGTPAEGHDDKGYGKSDLAVYGKLTDGDMMEGVDAWVTVMANKLLTDKKYVEAAGVKSVTMPLAFGAGASYKYAMGDVKYVKPFVELFGQTMSVAPISSTPQNSKGSELATAFNLGAEYGLFTNAIITVKYASGDTNDDLRMSLIKVGTRSDKGRATLAAKITY